MIETLGNVVAIQPYRFRLAQVRVSRIRACKLYR